MVLYLALKGDEAGLSEDAMSRIKSECLSDEGMSGTTWGGGDDDEPVSAAARKAFIGMALSDRKDDVASKILELLTRKLVEEDDLVKTEIDDAVQRAWQGGELFQ